jgi:hypothetical protein
VRLGWSSHGLCIALERGRAAFASVSAPGEAAYQVHEIGLTLSAQLAEAKEPGDEDDGEDDDDEFLPAKTEHGMSFSQ